MTQLYLDALPRKTSKGRLLRLLSEKGGINALMVGKINVSGTLATIDVPNKWASRLARALDGIRVENRNITAWSQAPSANDSSSEHFEHLMGLLDLEAKAEKEQAQQAMQRFSGLEAEGTGNSLVQLVITDDSESLGERLLLTLRKRNQTQSLPWTRLRVGSPILLSEEKGAGTWRGVVNHKNKNTIQVALEDSAEVDIKGATFRLDISNDEVARQRERSALQKVRSARNDRLAELRHILLFKRSPSFEREAELEPLDKRLNEVQREAIRFALGANDIAIIHGPPGTGKTTTVVELIRQAVRRGESILACAPSNLAVDNMFERLLSAGEKVLRLGHPSRVLPELREHTLDLLVDNHPDVRLARQLYRQASSLREEANKYKRTRVATNTRRDMRQEAKQLVDDARRLEAQVVDQILNSAKILCATTTSLDSRILGRRTFDLCVIDEAAQSTEPASWIPILRSQRLVLAGDHCQLPPTIISKEALKQGFGISLMERLMKEMGPKVSRRLTVQYRMNQAIQDFSSNYFYGSSLVASSEVKSHLLSELPEVENNELTGSAIDFIDTAGASYDEELEPDRESKRNPQEAELVCRKVEALIAAGVSPNDIAIISPYAAQVRLLRTQLEHLAVEIDTIDGFQGREKEVVIISLVRSNIKGDIGFLSDERRMNVALTRARRKLIVIGDSATITSSSFYQGLIEYFESIWAYRSVWEEMY